MSDARDCEAEPLPSATAPPADAVEAEEQDASRVVVVTIVRPLLDHEREGVLRVSAASRALQYHAGVSQLRCVHLTASSPAHPRYACVAAQRAVRSAWSVCLASPRRVVEARQRECAL